ncbi:MAG TPA: HDOD domain-containing protein [Syntrophorhabdaceae bacterium]
MKAIALLCAGTIILCLLFLFFRTRIKERQSHGLPAPAPVKTARLVGSHDNRYEQDPEIEAVLNLYPVLKAIPYVLVPEGAVLKSADAVEASARREMEQRISACGLLQANSGKLLNLLRDPESNPGEITIIVSTNPVFSAKLLRAVNSVYFSLPRRITSVGRAITLLGYNNVRSLVLQDALQSMIPVNRAGSDTSVKIWVHSAIVSACSAYLGKTNFGLSEYELATMGLLHDIGKYYMEGSDPGPHAHPGVPLPLWEEQTYGFTHAFLGSLVVEKWRLPALVSRAIAHHHDPSFSSPGNIPADCIRQSFIVCLADLTAKLLDYGGAGDGILPIRQEYFRNFGLPDDPAALITPTLIKEAHKARSIVESYVRPITD